MMRAILASLGVLALCFAIGCGGGGDTDDGGNGDDNGGANNSETDEPGGPDGNPGEGGEEI